MFLDALATSYILQPLEQHFLNPTFFTDQCQI